MAAAEPLPALVPQFGRAGSAMARTGRRAWLAGECAALFFGLPLVIYLGLIEARVITLLVLLSLVSVGLLAFDKGFSFKRVFQPLRRGDLMRAGLCGAVIAALVFTFTYVGDQIRLWESFSSWEQRGPRRGDELFLGFPRGAPQIWLVVMCLYPVFSALPQEILGRTFFFHRYKELFPTTGSMIWASATAFCFIHIVFNNWIAITFTLVGGYLFSRTYAKTGSLTAVWLEHSLYGCIIFTSGLGWFFYFTGQTQGG